MEEYNIFYENGQRWIRDYLWKGVEKVVRKVWHKNGQVFRSQFYSNGKKDGQFTNWYVNGRPRDRAFWRNDILEGECKNWRINGKICIHEFYRNGESIDPDFSLNKKLIFSRIRNNLQSRKFETLSNFLIRDLNSG